MNSHNNFPWRGGNPRKKRDFTRTLEVIYCGLIGLVLGYICYYAAINW